MNTRNILIVGATILAIFTSIATISYSALFAEIDLAANSAAPQAPVKIEIVAGSSLSRVAAELGEAGFLRSPIIFKLMARVRGVENSIRTGEYELQPGITPVQLLDKIVNGESVQYRITLVEGWTFEQALQAIWSADNIVPSLDGLSMAEVSASMNLGRENPEGLLYPDTYFYTKGTSDIELLLRASEKLNTVLSDAWAARLGALPYADQYEALTMASIIEKESASNSERGLIAAVFVSRMELGMRLQSDPTVIYGIDFGNIENRKTLTKNDLKVESAFNTYRNFGLPPSPICNPSRSAIAAALNPLDTNYLYFVLTKSGEHGFSETFEEHKRKVSLWRKFQSK